MLGLHPQVILAGRRINDDMGRFVAERTIKHMIANGGAIKGAKVTVLGLTFKEDCPDLRNSRVIDVIDELRSYGIEVQIHDPEADKDAARDECGVDLLAWDQLPKAQAIILAVAHKAFCGLSVENFKEKLVGNGLVIDVKSVLNRQDFSAAGIPLWRL